MKSFVFLGILLLLASIGGVVLYQQQQQTASPVEQRVHEEDPNTVVCWGTFDIKEGVTPLYPRQAGIIVFLVAEDTKVKTGDVLLQLDDNLAQLEVRKAKADVVVAEKMLAEAKLLTKQYRFQYEQQKSTIDALANERRAIELKRDSELPSAEGTRKTTLMNLYAAALAQQDERRKAEESKLKQVELLNAQLKIDQATADLQSKQIKVESAEELLNWYKIVAPSDGTVLRVHAHKGENLGPNPTKEAIDFLPDAPILVRAEVLQEWGPKVKPGQPVLIEDDVFRGTTWNGKVLSVSNWYAQGRNVVIEPHRRNDVRTLECFIEVLDGSAHQAIGQRVRANIRIGK